MNTDTILNFIFQNDFLHMWSYKRKHEAYRFCGVGSLQQYKDHRVNRTRLHIELELMGSINIQKISYSREGLTVRVRLHIHYSILIGFKTKVYILFYRTLIRRNRLNFTYSHFFFCFRFICLENTHQLSMCFVVHKLVLL